MNAEWRDMAGPRSFFHETPAQPDVAGDEWAVVDAPSTMAREQAYPELLDGSEILVNHRDVAPYGDERDLGDGRASEVGELGDVAVQDLASDKAATGPALDQQDLMRVVRDLRGASLDPLKPGEHSNEAYKVTLDDGARAVYKPAVGEAELRSNVEAGTYWRNEVAAYRVDKLLDFGLVPRTELAFGRDGVGSLQDWVSRGAESPESYTERDQQMMGVLDYVLGSSDRHTDNYRTQADGRPAAIDNGLCLPSSSADGLISEFMTSVFHKPLDASIVDRVRAVNVDEFANTLATCGIGHDAVAGATERLRECQSGQIDGRAFGGAVIGRKLEWLI